MHRLRDLTRDQLEQRRATDYCRWLQCLHSTGGPLTASRLFVEQFSPDARDEFIDVDVVQKHLDNIQTKAAIDAGATTAGSWGAPLVGSPSELMAGFVAYTNRQSILSTLKFLSVPVGMPVPVITTLPVVSWVGEVKAKPATTMAFASTMLDPAKAATQIAVTKELLNFAMPGGAELLRDVLAAALAKFIDQALTDPAMAAVAGVSPASLTNGTTAVTGAGTDPAADLGKLVKSYFASYTPTAPALILPTGYAFQLALSKVDVSALTRAMPLAVSPHVAQPVIVDQAAILMNDNGVAIDTSREATLELSTTPASPVTAAVVPTSMYQANMLAVRAERFASWKRPITASVSYLVTS